MGHELKPFKILDLPREQEFEVYPGIYITPLTCSMKSVKVKRRIQQDEIDKYHEKRLKSHGTEQAR